MKCGLTLLLASCCITSSSAADPPGQAGNHGDLHLFSVLKQVEACSQTLAPVLPLVRYFLLGGAGGWIRSEVLHHAVSAAAASTLKYLLEPPVYAEVVAARGENVTLPCILRTKPSQYRVKWTKVEVEKVGRENVIIISSGHACKTYGHLGRRASLRKAHVLDASLQLSRLELEDGGRYRCQLIHDLHDESVVIALRIEGMSQPCLLLFFFFFRSLLLFPGVVFPYQSKSGRYKLTYDEARRACAEQDGALASQQQLYRGNPSHLQQPGSLSKLLQLSRVSQFRASVFLLRGEERSKG